MAVPEQLVAELKRWVRCARVDEVVRRRVAGESTPTEAELDEFAVSAVTSALERIVRLQTGGHQSPMSNEMRAEIIAAVVGDWPGDALVGTTTVGDLVANDVITAELGALLRDFARATRVGVM